MSEIYCKCYKISGRIDFPKNSAKNENENASWRSFIRLSNNAVEEILKYSCHEKEIYLFRFGCVSFINFSDDEIKTAAGYIRNRYILSDPDESYENIESLHAVFGEGEDVSSGLSFDGKYYNTFKSVVPVILAKSVELGRLERELNKLIDDSETVIGLISRNKYRFFNKKLANQMSRLIKFNYDVLINASALDGAKLSGQRFDHVHGALNAYYEFGDRHRVFLIKLENAKRLINNYRSISFQSGMAMYYRIEILLLILFPIGDILRRNPQYVKIIYDGAVEILNKLFG